jgi:hypothetical protein
VPVAQLLYKYTNENYLCTMQGRKDLSPKIRYQVHLDMLVPQDNFYRKLDAALNLHFLYKATSKYYGSEGNESIDPGSFLQNYLGGIFQQHQ